MFSSLTYKHAHYTYHVKEIILRREDCSICAGWEQTIPISKKDDWYTSKKTLLKLACWELLFYDLQRRLLLQFWTESLRHSEYWVYGNVKHSKGYEICPWLQYCQCFAFSLFSEQENMIWSFIKSKIPHKRIIKDKCVVKINYICLYTCFHLKIMFL